MKSDKRCRRGGRVGVCARVVPAASMRFVAWDMWGRGSLELIPWLPAQHVLLESSAAVLARAEGVFLPVVDYLNHLRLPHPRDDVIRRCVKENFTLFYFIWCIVVRDTKLCDHEERLITRLGKIILVVDADCIITEWWPHYDQNTRQTYRRRFTQFRTRKAQSSPARNPMIAMKLSGRESIMSIVKCTYPQVAAANRWLLERLLQSSLLIVGQVFFFV